MDTIKEKMLNKLLPYDVAHYIMGAFINYYHQYKAITKRAKIRFEMRDWQGIQADTRDRQSRYRSTVGDTTFGVKEMMGDRIYDRSVWQQIKEMYAEDILNYHNKDVAETFFNSVFRHAHKDLGISADRDLMFVMPTKGYDFTSKHSIYKVYQAKTPVEVIRQILTDYAFDTPYEDLERDICYIMDKVSSDIFSRFQPDRDTRVEMLRSVFYRNKGAYLIGRTHIGGRIMPFVLPILHEENGVFVDAFLIDSDNISSIFSYNRSYFLVDVDIPHELVEFLKTILPSKTDSELYNSIGFAKHGKTELYRDFAQHLKHTNDQFIIAPGIKGMVMSVFTLPSYGYVFKVIKDRFDPPKKMTHAVVREKYELVSTHDRVGRMADTHEFENFVFDLDRFSDLLLEELKKTIPSQLKIEGNQLIIKHLYIEKKMIPLNLYLQTATLAEAEEVINEYGKAIKDLAAVNIFPGDMLLKNFGVTRLNRVVFYDYDEIAFLTECNFRVIPEPTDHYDEFSSEAWYSVGENDIFPEEFPRFLIGRREIREIFMRRHADLFDVKFWRSMQKRMAAGEIVDVFPYRQMLRFRKMYDIKKE